MLEYLDSILAHDAIFWGVPLVCVLVALVVEIQCSERRIKKHRGTS